MPAHDPGFAARNATPDLATARALAGRPAEDWQPALDRLAGALGEPAFDVVEAVAEAEHALLRARLLLIKFPLLLKRLSEAAVNGFGKMCCCSHQ